MKKKINLEGIMKYFNLNKSNTKEEWVYFIDLFQILNLNIKNRKFFEMDDFLYLFDNLFFLINDKIKFKKFVDEFIV